MESKFGDYKEIISKNLLDELEPTKKNKFIAVLKVKYPKEGTDIAANKEDIIELIAKNNKSSKIDAYIELLDIKNIHLIIGLELPNIYAIKETGKKQVSRYIGNFLSRKLYHDYGWSAFSNVENALFTTVEIKKVEE